LSLSRSIPNLKDSNPQRSLKGLSGCRVILNEERNSVIKISSGKNYNSRLQTQKEKQQRGEKIKVSNVIVPKIIRWGISEEGLFFFEMEYVNGREYKEFLSDGSPEEINFFIGTIVDLIRFFFSDSQRSDFSQFKNLVIEKINSLELDKEIEPDFIKFLETKVSSLDEGFFYFGDCHGDLSLPNILFCRENLALIDFLDSFIESPVVDLVKLKQDLFHLFSFLSCSDSKIKLRGIQSAKYIWKKIEKEFSEHVSKDSFKILEVVNFLRILPYAKQEETKSSILNIIKELPIYEEFNRSHGGKIL
jgi:tRNA A-37 threonylcarbamoyl transferase component Bud32